MLAWRKLWYSKWRLLVSDLLVNALEMVFLKGYLFLSIIWSTYLLSVHIVQYYLSPLHILLQKDFRPCANRWGRNGSRKCMIINIRNTFSLLFALWLTSPPFESHKHPYNGYLYFHMLNATSLVPQLVLKNKGQILQQGYSAQNLPIICNVFARTNWIKTHFYSKINQENEDCL